MPFTQRRQKQHKGTLNPLCRRAIQSSAALDHCRNRRRHLLKRLLKHLPKQVPASALSSPKTLRHAANALLLAWGFVTLTLPPLAHAQPAFKHSFLQGINVGGYSSPSFADIDNDGDMDAFIGAQDGTLRFYRNEGNNQFSSSDNQWVINPLLNIDVGSTAAAAFIDTDNDGDLDVFIGSHYGTIKFYQNNGTVDAADFIPADGVSIFNPLARFAASNAWAKPSVADIDGDGDLDIFVGDLNGSVSFYQNDNAGNFLPTDNINIINPLAAVNVGAYAFPKFADIDNDGDLDAFIGEKNGTLRFYQNNGTATVANFVPANGNSIINPLAQINVGQFSSLHFFDFDNDTDIDVAIGSQEGTVTLHANDGAGNFSAALNTAVIPSPVNAEKSYHATFADIDNDGDLDVFIGKYSGTVNFYQNAGNYVFNAANGNSIINPLAAVDVGLRATPAFIDVDNDGDLDAFIGEAFGTVKFYQNDGNNVFSAINGQNIINPLTNVNVGFHASLKFFDIDNDGDLDAFIGTQDGDVAFYQNNGTAALFTPANLSTVINPLGLFNLGINSNASATLADIDNDGDLDGFISTQDGTVHFYPNRGNNSFTGVTTTTLSNPLNKFNFSATSSPTFIDTDNDGDLDMFIGKEDGSVHFFENFDPSPITVADNAVTVKNKTRAGINVLANDTFKAEGPLSQFTISQFDNKSVRQGRVKLNADNTFTFIPSANSVGKDSFTYTLDDGLGNTAQETVHINITPTSAPVIQLLGDNPLALDINTPFIDSGSTVIDAVDTGLVASVISTVDETTVGNYTLTYTAIDTDGNEAIPVTRNVRIKDITAPVITLLGDNPLILDQGSFFTDPLGTVEDNLTPNIRVSIKGLVNTDVVGEYTLTYTAIDIDGNAAVPAVRTVQVIVPVAPIITLIDNKTLTVAHGSTFIDPGSTVTDNLDVGLVALVTGQVDTQTLGDYELTYTATDSANNSATPVIRTVTVTDQTAPVIQLKGGARITLTQTEKPSQFLASVPFIDPGTIVTDNVDSGLTATVTGIVNTHRTGTYTLSYRVTDTAGNEATLVTRTVIITPPKNGGGGALSWWGLFGLTLSALMFALSRRKRP